MGREGERRGYAHVLELLGSIEGLPMASERKPGRLSTCLCKSIRAAFPTISRNLCRACCGTSGGLKAEAGIVRWPLLR